MSDSQKGGSLVPTGVANALATTVSRPPAARVAQLAAAVQRREKVSIALFIDATASRQPTWDRATNLQTRLISELQAEFPNIELQIYCHRGDEAENVGTFTDGTAAQKAMRRIDCIGGTTKYHACFDMAARQENRPTIGVIIGDAWEGDDKADNRGLRCAQRLGVPIFAFHEGTDTLAFDDFNRLAQATKGACLPLK